MTRTIFIAAVLTLAVTLPAVPAQAQVNRTFVSGAGSDSNNCANVLTPCRHFATAYAATTPNGEIFVLDPANYGSLTITHGVNIEGHGWASIAPPNNGNAITINADVGDNISIHGVSINGTGATGGTNGIVFNSGGGLTITDCVVQNFAGSGPTNGAGILIQPTTGTLNFLLTNTIATNNAFVGIYYYPQSGSANANGVIDRVTAVSNGNGIGVNTTLASGGSVVIAISNSIASANNDDGLDAQNGPGTLTLSGDNVTVSENGLRGIFASGTPKVLLGRSVVTKNAIVGILNSTSPNTFYTYKDNRINLNGNGSGGTQDISAALNMTFAQQ
jgi:hypothetical protein